MILLKNEEHILPLQANDSIAIIGELAEKPRYQGGGSSHVNAYHVVTPLSAAKQDGRELYYAQGYQLDDDTTDEALIDQAIAIVKK